MRTSTRIAATVASAGLIAAAMAAPASAKPSSTIMDIVEGSSAHTTLEFVLEETGLDAVLEGKRQFTLFAPTDAAFAALPDEVVAALLSAEEKEAGYPSLTNILLYHVAPGERFSGDVVSSDKVRMISKQFADVDIVTTNPLKVTIADANINLAGIDLDASNGVVHVLDDVMLP